ncbi:PAS domain-containing protein [Geovibrio thiophilus]|nr:PAS domain-containing protein [Geovibrio thiophilus]
MKITKEMTVYKVVSEYPHLKEIFIESGFKSITDPIKFNTVAKVISLENACRMKDVDPAAFLEKLNNAVGGGYDKSAEMERHIDIDKSRADKIAAIVHKFFDGADKTLLQKKYDTIAPVTAAEFAYAEQLISDAGVPDSKFENEIGGIISLFRSSLESSAIPVLPAGHPVSTYIRENAEILKLTAEVRKELETITPDRENLLRLYKKLKDVNLHFIRKETQLFPYLEKKGFDKPTTVMWSLHDRIRKGIKDSITALEHGRLDEFLKIQESLPEEIDGMTFKEEKILFPTALMMLSEDEWKLIRSNEKELDYCLIGQPEEWGGSIQAAGTDLNGFVNLGEGILSFEQLNAVFSHLPFDISFVDENDRVKFYNAAPNRIFPRSPDVIGREVKYCHPPKSVATVMEILDSFRNGGKDKAEFWLTLHGRFLHIRYFAVRNAGGGYMGTLEVMQDATEVRQLEGSRTLLSWE